jgi:hypothetical protein
MTSKMNVPNHHRDLIAAAEQYIDEFGWRLVPVQGKRPVWDGWPDYYPTTGTMVRILTSDARLGIGLNLGGSGLIDIEADTPEGEMLLDDLCEGLVFPCWRSQQSKHRLFRDHKDVGYIKIEPFKIEFRADRHQLVLPPSLHPSARVHYRWLVNPNDVPPPELPEHVVEFYNERVGKPGNVSRPKVQGPKRPAFPFRDDLDYVLRHHDLLAEAETAGVKFVVREPDASGNIPCHVPAKLRGGEPDIHPSGIFNVRSGVLRDFATGRNHLYFQTLEAITGDGRPIKFKPYPLPEDLHSPGIRKSPTLARWLNDQGFRSENQHIPNLYNTAIHLLTQVNGSVLLERIPGDHDDIINVRFRIKHPLPEGKEVFILDATANETLIRALAPGWDIKIFEPPAVEQKGQIIQVMDYVTGHGGRGRRDGKRWSLKRATIER